MTSAAIVAVALMLLVGTHLFMSAKPATVALVMRNAGAWFTMAIGGLLMLRGQVLFGLPFVMLGLSMLGRGSLLGRALGGGAGPARSSGQRSRVRTAMLEMELDHDTGAMEGVVLQGKHAGHALSDLTLDQLLAVFGECETAGDQSASLLEAYLDRHHPDWHAEAAATGFDERQPHAGPSAMSRDEAFEILGLEAGAGEDEIRKAHKMLMKRFHPDHGGSSYLAAKINQAKDVLLP
ncbi:MAG: DnaJ domain-containing protein [Hyphomicrobiales bacterium]